MALTQEHLVTCGAGKIIPIRDGRLVLGTWQGIALRFDHS